MPKCGYCSLPAMAIIPAIPRDVCTGHAIEYWTALVAYARNHPPLEQEEGRELMDACRDAESVLADPARRLAPRHLS